MMERMICEGERVRREGGMRRNLIREGWRIRVGLIR